MSSTQTQVQTQPHVHTHARRRSRVSIHVLPETPEAEESEKPLLAGLSDRGSVSSGDHDRQPSQDSISLGHIDVLAPRPERRGFPWRVVLVFAVVTTICCVGTGAVVSHREGGRFERWAARVGSAPKPRRYVGGRSSLVNSCSDLTLRPRRRACNPYHQFGLLNVSLSTPSENVWQPIAAAEDCQPTNYLEMLAQQHPSLPSKNPHLEFLRGRTILVYGDSIDRDHVDDVCGFVGGRHELIHDKHPLSPPYPLGQESPPPGCTFSQRICLPDNG